MPTTNWYYDFISPFAYLQLEHRFALLAEQDVRPVPVLFGALLAHYENIGPAEVSPKRAWTYRYCQWFADTHGIDMRFPEAHPFNPISALRLAIAIDANLDDVRAMFRVIFATGLRPDTDAGFAALADAVGADDAVQRIADAGVKQRLRDCTDEAIARGVFGVPSLAVDQAVFWGNEGTDMYLQYLRDPTLLEREEMTRITSLPIGISRKR